MDLDRAGAVLRGTEARFKVSGRVSRVIQYESLSGRPSDIVELRPLRVREVRVQQIAVSESPADVVRHAVERLVAAYAPIKIILFGSHARGESRPDSDIDLLIIKDTTERGIDRWMTVRGILCDPMRTLSVETLILTPEEVSRRLAIKDQFITKILEEGVVLYAA